MNLVKSFLSLSPEGMSEVSHTVHDAAIKEAVHSHEQAKKLLKTQMLRSHGEIRNIYKKLSRLSQEEFERFGAILAEERNGRNLNAILP